MTQSAQPPLPDQAAFESLKLQYEVTARRYENIYQALWQNFSFMAAASAAILAFGKDALGIEVAAGLSCVPVLVWYWATFEPLNYYGDLSSSTLGKVERALAELLKRSSVGLGQQSDVRLFIEFNRKRKQILAERPIGSPKVACVLGTATFLIAVLIRIFEQLDNWGRAPIIGFLFDLIIAALAAGIFALFVVTVQLLMNQKEILGLRVRTAIRLAAAVLHLVFFLLLVHILALQALHQHRPKLLNCRHAFGSRRNKGSSRGVTAASRTDPTGPAPTPDRSASPIQSQYDNCTNPYTGFEVSMPDFPPISNHEPQIEWMISFLRCIVEPGKCAYMSAPITSGWRFVEFRKKHPDLSPDDPAYARALLNEVITPNREHAATIVKTLRSRLSQLLLDPTAVPDFTDWDQSDYRFLWGRVIEVYANSVIFVDGWNYSSGCSYEFLVTIRSKIAAIDEQGQDILRSSGRKLVDDAAREMREYGLKADFLEAVVKALDDLESD